MFSDLNSCIFICVFSFISVSRFFILLNDFELWSDISELISALYNSDILYLYHFFLIYTFEVDIAVP